jgi:uncharacterized protein
MFSRRRKTTALLDAVFARSPCDEATQPARTNARAGILDRLGGRARRDEGGRALKVGRRLRLAWIGSILVLGFFLGAASSASAASFDCAKAASPDEKAVCDDPQLSRLDDTLGRAWIDVMKQSDALVDRDKVRGVAREFLANRGKCGVDRRCIIVAYLDVLGFYDQSGANVSLPGFVTAQSLVDATRPSGPGIPDKVGDCATTTIASIGPRIDAAHLELGMTVAFANQVYQVSEGKEPNLLASRAGDSVIMCLASKPRFCPAGDDRGKIYLVTNSRTHGTWWLQDSQHMCGGA